MAALVILTFAALGRAGEIHNAAAEGNVERVKVLLARNPNSISLLDDSSQTPLHVAVHRGKLAVVKLLLENKADVKARAYNQFTPLHLASDPQIVAELLKYKPDLNARDSALCQTPLEAAASSRRTADADVKSRKIVKMLLDAGAPYDIHSAVYLNDIERVRSLLKKDPNLVKDPHGAQMLPLRLAAREGRTEICKVLLQFKADPHDIDGGCGYPVLHDGIAHPAVVKLLLEAGAPADVRVTWRGGRSGFWVVGDDATLLHFAAEEGTVESAKLLLQKGVKIDAVDDRGQTALQIAAWFKKAEMVRFLLDRGAAADAKDKGGFTPLHNAASEGDVKAVRFLLDKKADPVARDAAGRTPMGLAARGVWANYSKESREKNARYVAVIRELQARGVPTDLFAAIALGDAKRARDLLKTQPALADNKVDERPLLTWAVTLDHTSIVSLLLKSGAQANAKDERGYTALHSAAFWGRNEITRILIRGGANVNAQDNNGVSPLHESARMTTPAVAKLLLAAGARVNARDKHGKTPLFNAERGFGEAAVVGEMVELLRKNGAAK